MMKAMTCKQLGGACELEFRASTFEEMAELSKKHAMEMHQQNDVAHLKAMILQATNAAHGLSKRSARARSRDETIRSRSLTKTELSLSPTRAAVLRLSRPGEGTL